MMGKLAHRFQRFPLLLKFLDVHEMLSVQVHPQRRTRICCQQAKPRRPKHGSYCKPGAKSDRCGLKIGTTAASLRLALKNKTVVDLLAGLHQSGRRDLLPAGTVHALGDVVVFEIQQIAM